MQDNRWVINRAGLVNFWYYDEEIFEFSNGRLLLRGSNGSGKSVTMQSFIPLLLDGNKSPERLDPFGSKARKIENYILGEDENGKDESIGYLFMEFKKKHSDNLATIGMGFKAKRGKPLSSWGFSITDGRRIGEDFFLYKQLGEKIPLTMRELENRIGTGGQVIEGQKNYMKLVNDLIFGFDDLEEYDELIKLLVQLRSPKLSKDFKPTVIYEIMENSLQPLSEDDLRPMSEAIENMDNIKSRLEVLKDCKAAADRIRHAFDRYNQFIVVDKARHYEETHQKRAEQQKRQERLDREIETTRSEIGKLDQTIADLAIQLETQQDKKRELESHDSVVIREKIIKTEEEIQEKSRQRLEKDQHHENKRQQERELDHQISDYRQEVAAGEQAIDRQLAEMDELAEVFAFDEHAFTRDEMTKAPAAPYDFGYIGNTLKAHTETLGQAIKAMEKEKQMADSYEKLLLELELLKKEQQEKQRWLEQANRQLMEIQDETLEKFHLNNQHHREFIIPADGLNRLAREIHQFGPDSNVNGISRILQEVYHQQEADKRGQLYREQADCDQINQERQAKQAEIEAWKKIPDPQPQRPDKIIKNREKLVVLGIPHVPLYKALDFASGVDQKTRAAIEEAMADMGILDALILPASQREKIQAMPELCGDHYLFPEPQFMVHSINQYLQVDEALEGIDREAAASVLNSILIDQSHHTHLDEKGNYRLGILWGRATGKEAPRFIGASARKKYREEQLDRLETELGAINDRLEAKYQLLEQLKATLALLQQEFAASFKPEDLITAATVVKQAKFDALMSDRALEKKNEEEKTCYQQLQQLRETVHRITLRITLPLDLESYEAALAAAVSYGSELHKLEKLNLRLVHRHESLLVAESRYQEILVELDDLLYEMNQINAKRSALEITRANLSEQLQLTDYQAIQAELEQCLQALKTLPREKEEAVKNLERQKLGLERLLEEQQTTKNALELAEKVFKRMTESFSEELALGYLARPSESPLIEQARELVQNNPQAGKQNKEQITLRLMEIFKDNSQYLREYAVSSQYIFEDPPGEEDHEVLKPVQDLRRRLNITARVTGKVVNFYDLSDYLKDSLDETDKLLKESDRELFEDILVKNISKKISARIFHSEKWVDNMNQLMGKMDTSMGLSFSLKWSSKKAETEEQLDTKKLVNLLKMDGNLLREEDLNALSEHFRSKIALARRTLEDKGVNLTFHGIMRDILDYRKWFEFKLFFKKTGQLSKELTNNGFFKFSGGEKAMAMYVPLFSAVNARYEAAGKESARILSLDEAFAGVDEQNIRDMFRLLNELDLSYIINSQILWGDYDTVDALAISELIRPDNADFVTVLRYHWNGRVRRLVIDDAS